MARSAPGFDNVKESQAGVGERARARWTSQRRRAIFSSGLRPAPILRGELGLDGEAGNQRDALARATKRLMPRAGQLDAHVEGVL